METTKLAKSLKRLWINLQSDKFDRHFMVVGVMEALGFVIAALLVGGTASGCYAISGECLGGGCKDKDAGSYSVKDMVGAKEMKGGETKTVDAGPQATYPDGADGGTCYADVCAMPKECPADTPPVCWWFCKDYAGTWNCEKPVGTGTTSFDIAGIDKDGAAYCGIHFFWGDGTGAIPGTPPPLKLYGVSSVTPGGDGGKTLIFTNLEGKKFTCLKKVE